MTNYSAKIDTIVQRDFVYRSKRYKAGDLFLYNPNPSKLGSEQKHFLRTGMIKQLNENEYLYICLRNQKEFFGKIYGLNEVIDIEDNTPERMMLWIKRGSIKKVLKSNYDISQAEHKTSALNDKQTASELINNETDDEKITLSTIAVKANIKASMLKAICNDDLKMGIGNYTKQLTKEQEQEILSHIDKIRKEE